VAKGRSSREVSTRDQIFSYIVEYKRNHDGNAPSKSNIARACSVSIPTVVYHLSQLEIERRIRLHGRGPNNIEIVGGNWWLGEPPETSKNSPT